MILGKLTAEENSIKGLSDSYKINYNVQLFNKLVQKIVKTLLILKY